MDPDAETTITCARCGAATPQYSREAASWGEGVGESGLLIICGDCMTDDEKQQTALRTWRQIVEGFGEDAAG